MLIIISPLFSNEIEKMEILSIMEFPEPDLKIGKAINNPFFVPDFHKKQASVSDLKKRILSLEKDLKFKSNPDKFYEIANCYKDLFDNETAIKYYKKYLENINSDTEEISKTSVKGEIYYALSEIDIKTDKVYNLEKSVLYFTKSIELNPDDSSLLLKLGDCYLSLGKTPEALYYYKKASDKSSSDYSYYFRLQEATFQSEYSEISNIKIDDNPGNLQITEEIDFKYLQNAINIAPADLKESLKLQYHIYLLRLLLVKNELYIKKIKSSQFDFYSIYTDKEKKILIDADKFVKKIDSKNINPYLIRYFSGIINYLNSDFKNAFSDFYSILKEKKEAELVHDEILFISLYFLKDDNITKKLVYEFIETSPEPVDYLIIANLEFKNKNFSKALMFCTQSLKLDKNYFKAYSAMSVSFAYEGNYIAADEMIKKRNLISKKDNLKNNLLFNQMIINETAIALLKGEKERAYILFQMILSVDSNKKAFLVYDRYFNKNEKLQN